MITQRPVLRSLQNPRCGDMADHNRIDRSVVRALVCNVQHSAAALLMTFPVGSSCNRRPRARGTKNYRLTGPDSRCITVHTPSASESRPHFLTSFLPSHLPSTFPLFYISHLALSNNTYDTKPLPRGNRTLSFNLVLVLSLGAHIFSIQSPSLAPPKSPLQYKTYGTPS